MPTDDPQKAFTQIYYSYNNQIVVNAKQKLGMRTTVILSHPAAISNDDDKMVPTTNRDGNLSLSSRID